MGLLTAFAATLVLIAAPGVAGGTARHVPAEPLGGRANAAPGTITGTVTLAGAPLAGIGVSLAGTDSAAILVQHATDGTGRYSFDGVTAGTYRVLVWSATKPYPPTWYPGVMAWADAGDLVVTEGATVRADVAVAPAGSVVGSVRRGSTPVDGANIWAYSVPNGTWVRAATTGADGRYTMTGLVEGTYRIRAWQGTDDRWYPSADAFDGASDVEVPSGAEVPVEVNIARFGAIAAHVHDGTTPLGGVRLYLLDANDQLQRTETSDAAGDAAFTGLAPGRYRVGFGDPTRERPGGAWWLDAGDEREATPIDVTAGDTASVTQELFRVSEQPVRPFAGGGSGGPVAVIGDSITAQSSSEIAAAVSVHAPVSVRGINNMRIDQLQPVADRFADASPDQVVIALGSNDASQGWPLDQSAAALDLLVGSFPTARCIDVLTVNDHTSVGAFNRAAGALNGVIRELPRIDPRVRVVEWQQVRARYLAAGQPDGEWTTDLVHLNQRGQTVYGELIGQAVAACDAAPSSLAGTSFHDIDGDGVVGAADPGLVGGSVGVHGIDVYGAEVTRSVPVTATGAWLADGLWPGRYELTDTPPAGFAAQPGVVGSSGGSPISTGVTAIELGPGAAATGYDLAARPSVVGLTPPDAPTAVTAQPGHGAVRVGWAAPTVDGGTPITGYRVVAQPGGGSCTAPANRSTCTVGGLLDGTGYTFTVVAGNGMGEGPPSPSTGPVVPLGVPDPPIDVTASAAAGSAVVTWVPPPDPGSGAVNAYRVVAEPGGATCRWIGGPTSCVVDGLVDGVAHTFTVVAGNAAGEGLPSTASPPVVPGSAPDPPAGVRVASGPAAVSVAWDPPADGGPPIRAYEVIADPGGRTCTWHGGPTRCLLTGLVDGTDYTFTVTAANDAGRSPAVASAPTVPVDVPVAPGPVTVVPTDGALVVSWAPTPEERGRPVDRYTVRVQPGPGACDWAAGPLTCTVGGLVNGVDYRVEVTAYNAIGASLARPAPAPVGPARPPARPTAVAAVAGNGSATVRWSMPVDDGGAPVIGAVVTADPGGATCSWTTGPPVCTVTGLDNGVSYRFTVVATNRAGPSDPSDPSAPVVPAQLPGPPTAVTAVPGNREVVVSWDPPLDDGGAPIDAYTVTVLPGGGSCRWTEGPRVCTVGGLDNGVPYTVAVTAHTGIGAGPPGSAPGAVVPFALAGPPTAVVATPGKQTATVMWQPPGDAGGFPVTSYTVTSTPDGATCTWTDGPLTCTVTGLRDGTAYTFTVEAVTERGTGSPSDPSLPVVPWSGAGFHAVTPFRVWDSRGTNGPVGPIGPAGAIEVPVAGQRSVPVSASAVVLNVTVTGPTAASFLSVAPAGAPAPPTAELLFAPGQTVPNHVTVGLGAGGAVTFRNAAGSVHVIADVLGYYDDGSGDGDRFTPVEPTRLLDSRSSTGGWGHTPLGPGQARTVVVRGAAGVPDTARAVVLNLTATGGTSASFLQAYPTGASRPITANLLFAAGQTVPNLVTVGIGGDGTVSLYNQKGSVDIVADVVGWYDPAGAGRFHALEPRRIVDSRETGPAPWTGSPILPGGNRRLVVAGLPSNAVGVVGTATVTGGTRASYLTVSPAPGPVPAPTATVLFAAGQTVPNAFVVGVGAGSTVDVFNQLGTVHVVADLSGYFAPT